MVWDAFDKVVLRLFLLTLRIVQYVYELSLFLQDTPSYFYSHPMIGVGWILSNWCSLSYLHIFQLCRE
jgi:hypothetical protein